MQADGSLHPTNDNSSVIHLLEVLTQADDETIAREHSVPILVIDGMAVV